MLYDPTKSENGYVDQDGLELVAILPVHFKPWFVGVHQHTDSRKLTPGNPSSTRAPCGQLDRKQTVNQQREVCALLRLRRSRSSGTALAAGKEAFTCCRSPPGTCWCLAGSWDPGYSPTRAPPDWTAARCAAERWPSSSRPATRFPVPPYTASPRPLG